MSKIKEPSDQQKLIFGWFKDGKGNAQVEACAGTGKTTTIVEGVGYAPEQSKIVCAFNKRIADELTVRLEDDPYTQSKTLHGIGFGFVRRNVKDVRVESKRIERIAKTVLQGTGCPRQVQTQIQKLATLGKELVPLAKDDRPLVQIAEDFDCVPSGEFERMGFGVDFVAARAFRCMELSADVERDGEIDFADMLYVPIKNKWVTGSYDLVVVDEAQDMNPAQLLLALKVCRKGGRICVVGDPFQAIYAFRGADSSSMPNLKKKLNAQVFGLTTTYRCPKKVVELAQKLVPHFQAAPSAPEGEVLVVEKDRLAADAQAGDFVISRLNAPLMTVCLGFIKAGKKARIEGKDIGKNLVSMIERFDQSSVEGLLDDLDAWEEKQVVRAQKRKNTSRIQQVQDQADMLRVLADECDSVWELKKRINDLFVDTDGRAHEFIVCSSIHKAKGLEADNVFLLHDTLYFRGVSQEEKNLEYVGITRAKKKLVLVYGFGKKRRGLEGDEDSSIRRISSVEELAADLDAHALYVAEKHHGAEAVLRDARSTSLDGKDEGWLENPQEEP